MRISKILKSFYWSMVFFSVILPSVAAASSAMDSVTSGLTTTANTAGFGSSPLSITDLVGKTINIVLGLVGIALLGYLIYAGFLYFTSEGDEKKTKKAKDVITNTIIGLIIVIAAYAISSYIMGALAVIS